MSPSAPTMAPCIRPNAASSTDADRNSIPSGTAQLLILIFHRDRRFAMPGRGGPVLGPKRGNSPLWHDS